MWNIVPPKWRSKYIVNTIKWKMEKMENVYFCEWNATPVLPTPEPIFRQFSVDCVSCALCENELTFPKFNPLEFVSTLNVSAQTIIICLLHRAYHIQSWIFVHSINFIIRNNLQNIEFIIHDFHHGRDLEMMLNRFATILLGVLQCNYTFSANE